MKKWQVQLGGWGTILWLASFQAGEFAREQGFNDIATMTFGYTLGFTTAFVGYLFWEIMHGRWEAILGEERGMLRITSLFPLAIITLLGAFGFINGIFNSMPWFYNVSFVFSGIVVAQGLVPIINKIDGKI